MGFCGCISSPEPHISAWHIAATWICQRETDRELQRDRIWISTEVFFQDPLKEQRPKSTTQPRSGGEKLTKPPFFCLRTGSVASRRATAGAIWGGSGLRTGDGRSRIPSPRLIVLLRHVRGRGIGWKISHSTVWIRSIWGLTLAPFLISYWETERWEKMSVWNVFGHHDWNKHHETHVLLCVLCVCESLCDLCEHSGVVFFLQYETKKKKKNIPFSNFWFRAQMKDRKTRSCPVSPFPRFTRVVRPRSDREDARRLSRPVARIRTSSVDTQHSEEPN